VSVLPGNPEIPASFKNQPQLEVTKSAPTETIRE